MSNPCPIAIEQEYLDRLGETSQAVADALNKHESLMGMAVNNPGVVEDIAWQDDMVASLLPIRSGVQDFRTVKASPSVQPIHDDYMRSLNMIDQAITLVEDGFRWVSPYKIQQGYDLVEEAMTYTRSATGKIAAFCLDDL